MSQTGVRSTASRRQAFRNRSARLTSSRREGRFAQPDEPIGDERVQQTARVVLGEAGIESNLFHAALAVDLRQHHPLAGVERDLFSRLAFLGQNELGNQAGIGNLLLQKLALVAAARALEQQNRGVLLDRFLAAAGSTELRTPNCQPNC